MITVSISINAEPIFARSASRVEQEGKIAKYKTDCGNIIEHNYDDGAVVLAHKLLDLYKGNKLLKEEPRF